MAQLRIIGGRHRRRTLEGPTDRTVRPTADRVRQAVFDMLEHGRLAPDGGSVLRDAVVLDAFCGTGAMGLEALSRGAAALTLMDNDRAAVALARRNLQRCGETADVVRGDATRPGAASRPHDLVFLDPPYASGTAAPALLALRTGGWIAAGAVVVVETAARGEPFTAPEGFAELDRRRHGAAEIVLLRMH